jgi:hypothetical protein
VTNSFKSAAVIGLIVVLMMTGFDRSPQGSMSQSIFLCPLLPGAAAGLLFSGHGGNMAVAYFSCWLVNTSIYWGLWVLVSRVIWPRFRS